MLVCRHKKGLKAVPRCRHSVASSWFASQCRPGPGRFHGTTGRPPRGQDLPEGRGLPTHWKTGVGIKPSSNLHGGEWSGINLVDKYRLYFYPYFYVSTQISPVFHDFITFFCQIFAIFVTKTPPSALGAKKKDQIYPTHLTKRPKFCATKISLPECVRRKAVKFFFQPTVQGGPDRRKGVTARSIFQSISFPPPAEVRPSSPRGWFRKALARMPPPAAPPQRQQPRPLLPAPAHVSEMGENKSDR